METPKLNFIPRENIICSRLFREVLGTHSDLTEEDVNNASELICISRSNMVTDVNLQRQLATILLHMNKRTNTGRFSLSFNRELDETIKNKDSAKLCKLTTVDVKNLWPEFYENDSLTEGERKSIFRLYNREALAILNVIENIISMDDIEIYGALNNFLISPKALIESSIRVNNRVLDTTLYQECYEGVCVFEDRKDLDEIVSRSSDIPDTHFVVDPTTNGDRVFCFLFMDLIRVIHDDPCINPFTGNNFSEKATKLLRDRFMKEIKMYHVYRLRYDNP